MGSPREKFGKGGTGSGAGFVKYERWQLSKEVTALPPLRIVPPIHSLQDNEEGWGRYHSQHFGYVDFQYQDKTKTRQSPFACVEVVNRKTDMVEVSCAECREIERYQKIVSDIQVAVKDMHVKRGILDEKTIEKAYKEDPGWISAMKWLQVHNLDRKWYVNCVALDGKLGVLKLAHKHMLALKTKMKELRAQNFEPMNDFDSGCYFVFKRSGNGSQTIHTVEVYFENTGTAFGSQTLKLAPISDDTATAILATLPDLTTVVKKISPEQVKLLVEGDGSPDNNSIIFGMTQRKEGSAAPAQRSQMEVPSSVLPNVNVAPQPPVAPPVVPSQQVRPPVQPPAVVAPPVTPPAAPSAADIEARIRAQVEAEVRAKVQAQMQAQIEAQMAASQQERKLEAPVVPQGLPANFDPLDPNVSPEQFASQFPPLPNR